MWVEMLAVARATLIPWFTRTCQLFSANKSSPWTGVVTSHLCEVRTKRCSWDKTLLSPSHLFQVLKWEMCFSKSFFKYFSFFSSSELSPVLPIGDRAGNEGERSAWRSAPNPTQEVLSGSQGPGGRRGARDQWALDGSHKAFLQNGVQVPSC